MRIDQRDRQRASQRKHRAKALAAGMCSRCSAARPVPGMKQCARCLADGRMRAVIKRGEIVPAALRLAAKPKRTRPLITATVVRQCTEPGCVHCRRAA